MCNIEGFYMTGPGWWKMLDLKLKDMYDVDKSLCGVRVKEKFGHARVEYDEFSPNRAGFIQMHEETIHRISGETCELCGQFGTIRADRNRMQCRCDRCEQATREERNEIMRQTMDEYRATLSKAVLPDTEPSEREQAYIRYALWGPETH